MPTPNVEAVSSHRPRANRAWRGHGCGLSRLRAAAPAAGARALPDQRRRVRGLCPAGYGRAVFVEQANFGVGGVCGHDHCGVSRTVRAIRSSDGRHPLGWIFCCGDFEGPHLRVDWRSMPNRCPGRHRNLASWRLTPVPWPPRSRQHSSPTARLHRSPATRWDAP